MIAERVLFLHLYSRPLILGGVVSLFLYIVQEGYLFVSPGLFNFCTVGD